MKTKSVFLRGTADGYLRVLTHEPESGDVDRVVLVLHGMGEHAERYTPFASYMTAQGMAVIVHDHRKHGKSIQLGEEVGILGKNDLLDAMVDDVSVVVDYIKSRHPEKPIALLGHSMGSVIARMYLTQADDAIDKVVLSGTLPRYGKPYIKLMRALALISGVWVPQHKRHRFLAVKMNAGLIKKIPEPDTPLDWLTRDADIVKGYIDDPLCGFAYNKRFYRSFFKLIDRVNRPDTIRKTKPVPMLLISGSHDPLNDKASALESVGESYKRYADLDVMLESVEGARHEVLNEFKREETYALIN